jgi:4-amino-4-deoxy-L-arabinose transferase-like glycosyltransferase
MRKFQIWTDAPHWAIPLLLVLGIAVRVAVWLQNRALFLDEANLARNFCERGLWDFFRPLDHEQYAPPLFCFFQKCSVLLLGQHEYALRLFPLLVRDCIGFPVFHDIARRLISGNPWALAATCCGFFVFPIFSCAMPRRASSTDAILR